MMKLNLSLLAGLATMTVAAAQGQGPAAKTVEGGAQAQVNPYVARTHLQADAIFGNQLPVGILDMGEYLPRHTYEDGQVKFAISQEIRDKLASFEDDPSVLLKGACLQTMQGWRDGKRLHDLADVLGQETRDMLIEYVLFDFVLNECQWLENDFEWGCTKNEWTYANQRDNEILRDLSSDHGFLITEVTDWFSWWIENEQRQGKQIYQDSIIQWKEKIIGKFLALQSSTGDKKLQKQKLQKHKKHKKVIATAAKTAKKAQLERRRRRTLGNNGNNGNNNGAGGRAARNGGDDKNQGKGKAQGVDFEAEEEGQGQGKRQQGGGGEAGQGQGEAEEETEEDACNSVNPVEFFGSKWDRVARFLQKFHEDDVLVKQEKGSNGMTKKEKKEKEQRKQQLKGVETTISLVTEVCEGVCVRIGAGFTWNSLTNSASIDWSYGLATRSTEAQWIDSKTNRATDSAVHLNLALRCDCTDADSSASADDDDENDNENSNGNGVLSFGKMVADTDMEMSLLIDPASRNMVGLTYSVGMGMKYQVNEQLRGGEDGDDEGNVNANGNDVHFAYMHSGKMARYAKGKKDACISSSALSAASQIGLGGQVIAFGGAHWGLLAMIVVIGVCAVFLNKICYLRNGGKRIEETQPLLKKRAHAHAHAMAAIYSGDDEYSLLPNNLRKVHVPV